MLIRSKKARAWIKEAAISGEDSGVAMLETNRDQQRISSLTTACAGLTSLPAGLDASPAPRGIDVRLGL